MFKNVVAVLVAGVFCVSLSFSEEQGPKTETKQVVVSTASQASVQASTDTRKNIEKLSDPDPLVRRAVVNALMASGDTGAASALIERLKVEGNSNVKINIVSALGEMRSKPAVAMLKKLLKDPYPILRNEAIRALGKINVPDTYPQIAAMLRDEADGVRVIAAETVATLRIFSAVPDLLDNLQNPKSEVRRSAADALGEVGDTRVVLKLEKLLNDTDKSVAAAAKNAIEKIKAKPAQEKSQALPPPPNIATK